MNTTTEEKHLPEDFKLPNVLKVTSGSIHISTEIELGTLAEFESYQRELTHLLALIPDADKAEATVEDDGFYVVTDNLPALKYACNKYFLCVYSTAVEVVINTYGEEVHNDFIGDLIDEVGSDYEAQILSDGLYLVREN